MRIVIDMQGAQSTGSRNRGIGRYSKALAQGIIRQKGEHEVILALNGSFAESVAEIRAEFSAALSADGIHVWHPTGAAVHMNAGNAWCRQSSELLREAFIASLRPDMVLITSMFEGFGDNAVTSIGLFAPDMPTAVVLYDLIPLIHRDPYLSNPEIARWYEEKLAYVRKADLQLAISASSRQESLDCLGSAADAVVNISTAADPQFRPQIIEPEVEQALRERYGLHRPFVMYTGGIDHRKNIEGLIRAYAMLPSELRVQHQLAVVCSVRQPDRKRLQALARQRGLAADELILTGFVPEDDLLALYNLCKVFVFPSWHEGFGLPALEAMACGRATIGANCSSLPEVIGWDEALFDPRSDSAIAEKLRQVLTDIQLRQSLERHGIAQAARFSWDKTAMRAIEAMERCHARYAQKRQAGAPAFHAGARPRLAYVSPVPPERSGIADYSAELLPALARHYDIEVILSQDKVTDAWVNANCPQRSVKWFRANASRYDRVLYHFGNSSYHQHMFELLKQVPGVVVLHDFYLSNIVWHMECNRTQPGMCTEYLYGSHGYAAVHKRFEAQDASHAVWGYPSNYPVLQGAQGVIVHSQNSIRLADEWYGLGVGAGWEVIPLLRSPAETNAALVKQAREALRLHSDQYVVCSFGFLGAAKLNHRLVRAWLDSPLAHDERCLLIFVGENDAGRYGDELNELIARSACASRIRITGWADTQLFRNYLHAADVGVQLRTLSRGETSAAVLDCMNHGLATIVNANGSMADLPSDGVWMLPDQFDDAQLAEALTVLRQDAGRRAALSERAQAIVRTRHAPVACASLYSDAIEQFHRNARNSVPMLIQKISALSAQPDATQLSNAAYAIDQTLPPTLVQRQLLVDVSELVQHGARTDIQRVVLAILQEWLQKPPHGYRVEPVYASKSSPGYRYARQFTLDFMGCPSHILSDEPVSYRSGDHFIGLELQPEIIIAQQARLQEMRQSGVDVRFIVYDLLLLQFPHFFADGFSQLLEKWLRVVAGSDGVVCISNSVAQEVEGWIKKIKKEEKQQHPFKIDWFHLGADMNQSAPSRGMPADAEEILSKLGSHPGFLMVGTLEPRKAHQQVLEAFEQLWNDGQKIQLVIVGKQGWMVESLAQRIRTHPELGKRLFWLENVSDEYLEKIYAASACLVLASYGEGFGLPLIEAAQHKLPIVARDLPVFREVAGTHAYYFNATQPSELARALRDWLALYRAGQHPHSGDMPWLTWKESAARLGRILLEKSKKRAASACQSRASSSFIPETIT